MLHDFLTQTLAAWAADESELDPEYLVALELNHGEALEECGNSYRKLGLAICEKMGFESPIMDLIFEHAPKAVKNQLVRGFAPNQFGMTVFCDVRLLLQTGENPSKDEFKALKLFIDKVAEISKREGMYLTKTRGSLLNEVERGRTDYSISFEEEKCIPELMEFAKNNETLNKVFILLAKRLRRIGRYSWCSFSAEDIFGQEAIFKHFDEVLPPLSK